jgi:hypothetical protein
LSFFEPKPPDEPPAQSPPVPDWLDAPKGWLGGGVGTRVVLATTPDVAVLAHKPRMRSFPPEVFLPGTHMHNAWLVPVHAVVIGP